MCNWLTSQDVTANRHVGQNEIDINTHTDGKWKTTTQFEAICFHVRVHRLLRTLRCEFTYLMKVPNTVR